MLDRFGDMPAGITSLRMDKMDARGLPPMQRAIKQPAPIRRSFSIHRASGRPKGVMLSGDNLVTNVVSVVVGLNSDRDCFLSVLPQFHNTISASARSCLSVSAARPCAASSRSFVSSICFADASRRPSWDSLDVQRPDPVEVGQMVDSFARYIVSGGEPLPDAVMRGSRNVSVRGSARASMTETSPVTGLPSEGSR